MAHLKDPLTKFREYRSIETATAFLNDFWVNVVVEDADSDDDGDDGASLGDTANHDGETEGASDIENADAMSDDWWADT